MPTKLLLLFVALASLLVSCNKSSSKAARSTSQNLITQARNYFNVSILGTAKTANPDNYRANQPRSVLWEKAMIKHLSIGDAVIAPIAYQNELFVSFKQDPTRVYNINTLTSLVIIRDSNSVFHVVVITFFPDTANSATSPKGVYFLEDWQGNSLITPVYAGVKNNNAKSDNPKEVSYIQTIQVCNQIDGYNYSVDDPANGETWSETSCTTYGLPSEGSQSGIPTSILPSLPGQNTPPLEVIISPPTNPISNIAAYFQCFTNSTSNDHTYNVTLCVSQPVPDTRTPWTLSPAGSSSSSSGINVVNAGHTWLILTENSAGSMITRNVGFYPDAIVTPRFPSDQGILDDNEQTNYNISVTFSVTNSQFFNMLSYIAIGNNSGYIYDLYDNNCTTFALHALSAGGINIATQQGSWGGGTGDDPGDLGEDLRSMALPANATLSTANNPHPNQGSCN